MTHPIQVNLKTGDRYSFAWVKVKDGSVHCIGFRELKRGKRYEVRPRKSEPDKVLVIEPSDFMNGKWVAYKLDGNINKGTVATGRTAEEAYVNAASKLWS